MCYDAATNYRRQISMARKQGADEKELKFLELKLEQAERNRPDTKSFEYYYTSGFSHKKLGVITADNPEELQFFDWGLIPFWVKDKQSAIKLSNQTLNARGETIFEKPSFRAAAKNKRCLVVLSGYYEHYWADKSGKRKIPYYIEFKNQLPMYMSGLWEEWVDKETGEVKNTVSIVTTVANEALAKVHNRDANNPRMLNIMPHESKLEWLHDIQNESDKEFIKSLIKPYPQHELTIYPVGQLRGKNGLGDVPKAQEKQEYPELELPLFD
ncbi:SOS response-associated peptidase [Fulvivirga lutimaris]|uniref:SOS response-associated peptidase n=1 Tax=Fulvivirga lutimaris TaxID=1819566 RepID=UPI0012BCDC86|nr:SOS response-associated peptidase [Fulvivirga lutimaris]MTI39261.1 SOS response-associated peptidase [Fulvivirga lutimaris]